MALTPRDILYAAYGKSVANRPGTLVQEESEYLAVLGRVLRACFALAAQVNPTAFGVALPVAGVGGQGWPLPNDLESLFRLETAGGAEVVVVPYDDRRMELGTPAVYRLGAYLRAAGNVGDPDPATDALTFWYSRSAIVPTDLDATIDAAFPDAHDEVLVLASAAYMALKDRRLDELGTLDAQFMGALGLFVAWLEHGIANERRRFGLTRAVVTESRVSLASLLGAPAMPRTP